MSIYAIRLADNSQEYKLTRLLKGFGLSTHVFIGEDDYLLVPDKRDGRDVNEEQLRDYLNSEFGENGYNLINIKKTLGAKRIKISERCRE